MSAPKDLLQSVFQISLHLHHLNKEAERRTGLSLVQWAILNQVIAMPAISPQELSEAVKLHPSTLTQSLKRLQRKSLIFISEDPRDSRKKVISLTRYGKAALDRAMQPMEQIAANLAEVAQLIYTMETHFSALRHESPRIFPSYVSADQG